LADLNAIHFGAIVSTTNWQRAFAVYNVLPIQAVATVRVISFLEKAHLEQT
jgi:hypothetical protein